MSKDLTTYIDGYKLISARVEEFFNKFISVNEKWNYTYKYFAIKDDEVIIYYSIDFFIGRELDCYLSYNYDILLSSDYETKYEEYRKEKLEKLRNTLKEYINRQNDEKETNQYEEYLRLKNIYEG